MSRTFTFAVVCEAKSEQLAFEAAMSNPLTKPVMDGRVNWKFLDSWVIFPFDKLAMFRVNGVFSRGPDYVSQQRVDLAVGGKRSDTCWALRIQPLSPGNKRLVFFAVGDELAGPLSLGPVNAYDPDTENTHDKIFISDQ